MSEKIYTEEEVNKIWQNYSGTSEYKKDKAGAWMNKSLYGKNMAKGEGWEIDHIKPKSKGGSDELSNLRPLQWENNRAKSDNYPKWTAKVSSDGNSNIYKEQEIVE
ncbi:MAG: HNH endonuclease [Endomicrobia bacterium]|nr:HNH endonuclease [Endomicrobiia bacterium]